MDPDRCLELWREAGEQKLKAERREAAQNLRTWVRGGGFEPQWTAGERRKIMCG